MATNIHLTVSNVTYDNICQYQMPQATNRTNVLVCDTNKHEY